MIKKKINQYMEWADKHPNLEIVAVMTTIVTLAILLTFIGYYIETNIIYEGCVYGPLDNVSLKYGWRC